MDQHELRSRSEPTGVPGRGRGRSGRVSQGLDERPVDEHVGVFERAHEQLRRALDAQPDADGRDGDQGA